MRLVTIIAIALCSTCFAQNQLYIFFLNGVNTTPDEADANLSKLESLIAETDEITWNTLYNATYGVIKSDVWDVMRQKKAEAKNYSITQYKIKNPNATLQDYLSDRTYTGKNLKDIVDQFHNRFPTDFKEAYALIISHSQGNQYANQLWDYLVNGESFPRDHIALFGIASPADRIYGDIDQEEASYVTASNDKVINLSRLLGNGALPANVKLRDCYDFSCHNLIEDYLNDETVRYMVCNKIGKYMNLWLNMQPLC